MINGLTRFGQHNAGSKDALGEFLEASALVRSPDEEEATGQVTLMTLHSAKGLEFPYVFMVGVEEDLLPHRKSMELGGELSEERRLIYVGITRAKKRLWLTWCKRRLMRGKWADRGSSRFLEEIPDTDGTRRWARDTPPTNENSDEMAADFFARMKAELGIETD